jgi:hypothetical protein
MTVRVFVPAVAALAAYVASGCAVALGPGYTVEKQRIEVTYRAETPGQVAVRAWYELKNTGTKPLERIDVDPPTEDLFAPQDLRIEWRGKAMNEASAKDEEGHIRVPLGASWSVQESGEFVVAYNLNIGPEEANPDSSHGRAFFLGSAGWYPLLLPAQGAFATGGTPPLKWDLAVSVPEGFRVHASGDTRARKRSDEKIAGEIFVQQPGTTFDPFVEAGPFMEQQVNSSAGPVVLWTAEPVSARRANEIAKRVGADVSFFRTEFGAPAPGKKTTWIIGCHSDRPAASVGAGHTEPNCPAAPNSAVVSSDFFADAEQHKSMENVDMQLAATWLQFPPERGHYSAMFPLSAIENYAVFSLDSSQNPSSRDGAVRDLLQRVAAVPDAQKPLITVDEKDPATVVERGRLQSELFFIALEDRCGAENLHRGIARASRLLRGQSWSLPDLRSAVEAECGGPILESFFREWMHGMGVPEEFRARYLGAAVKKSDE